MIHVLYKAWRKAFQIAALAATLSTALTVGPAQGEEDPYSGVILMYHRFGESDLPSTNIKMDQFRQHLAILDERNQPVLPLGEMMAKVKAGEKLPDRAVAITVDDAYRSFMTEAWPLLKKKGYPVTLFVATEPVDKGYRRYLSWDEIRRLREEGVTIGHHSASHLRMVKAGVEESRADIRRANDRFRAELGSVPSLYAYPYGEYSTAVRDMIEGEGFEAAMAQHSGGVHTGADAYTVPRFALNERFGDADRFRMISQVRAFNVADVVPEGPLIDDPSKNPPAYGFTVQGDVPGLTALNCFSSHQSGRIAPKVLPNQRVEIRYDKPMPAGRHRSTCTLPGPDGRWYWLGKFFYVPEDAA